jgi:TolB protein
MKTGIGIALLLGLVIASVAQAAREPVLRQIGVPHDYYFREMYLPQLTTGPSALAWSPDGQFLVYSMAGSLWKQQLGSTEAVQLTQGPGYDFQPDWSSTGKIVFSRYHADALELHLLDLASGKVRRLTSNQAVNLDARWSPDGRQLAWISTAVTGRFKLFTGELQGPAGKETMEGSLLVPDRRSERERYYYSEFDHELSPSWSPDGQQLAYITNPEVIYGTGGIWRRRADGQGEAVLLRDEETSWRARPDWSPDGKRLAYSSYLGRQWHQLLVTSTAGGGDPIPLSYGEFDVTAVRWSPDGNHLAYITNEAHNTAIWIQDTISGRRHRLEIDSRSYQRPHGQLVLQVVDEAGNPVPARVAVTGSDGRSYAPETARIHGDDGFDRQQLSEEVHYFHMADKSELLTLPEGNTQIKVWRGLEHAIASKSIRLLAGEKTYRNIIVRPLNMPARWSAWRSGDLHVHMNYGGTYRNRPADLVAQAEAEDLDLVYNLIVNKEQRIPDIQYFSPEPDAASSQASLLLHGQEFHTSYWGHMGLLDLRQHYLLPDYVAYPNTAAASLWPDNLKIAELAQQQSALVGYVHPFNDPPDPENDAKLTNALPVNAALGLLDYLEVVGFSWHRETASVWYRLLNCGFRPVAAAGTDAMANYASLRGPVGLTRVYVDTGKELDFTTATAAERKQSWLDGMRAGRTMVTNAPLLGFELGGQGPGGEIKLAKAQSLDYSGFLRSMVAMDHLEIVVNGQVARQLQPGRDGRQAELQGSLEIAQSSWVLLRAWNEQPHPDVLDIYPYATTNPVFIEVAGEPLKSSQDADYFIAWIERIAEAASVHPDYNTEAEQQQVMQHLSQARERFEQCR